MPAATAEPEAFLHEPYPLVTPYPIDNYLSSAQFSDNYQVFLLDISSGIEPQSYKEAIEDENWQFAVEDEIVSLDDLGTWTVVDLPLEKKLLAANRFFA